MGKRLKFGPASLGSQNRVHVTGSVQNKSWTLETVKHKDSKEPEICGLASCISWFDLYLLAFVNNNFWPTREKIHISIVGSKRVRRWSFLAASPYSEYSYIGSMNKLWITKSRNSIEYERGVRRFIDFAFENSLAEAIVCPCLKCSFRKKVTKGEMYDHLICTQFPKEYTLWFYHGEIEVGDPSSNVSNSDASNAFDDLFNQDSIHDMLGDAFGTDMHWANEVSLESDEDIDGVERVMPDVADAAELEELASHAELLLYEGCTRYSRLSFLVKMYHIKCICGMTDKAISMIFELLHDVFEHAEIPSSFYEAKKTILKLGMNYEKIHACPNNCMLYWGEDKEKEMCKVCNRSRWKLDTKGGYIQESNDGNIRKNVSSKVLCYFPLKPHLQRLFLSSKTAEAMRWHDVAPKEDGVIAHPRDSEAWKMFDLKNTSFAEDPRNIHLALATDGINPYRSMNANSSTWPVILIPYNTPPWICMKRTSFILLMIIPGKKMPGNNIDVYLQPLIKELKELWNDGVDAYDSFEKKAFKLHATLMWTISDFPGLGILSGWNTHQFRLNRVRFNGDQEFRNPPKRLSGLDILEKVKDINVTFGRKEEAKVRGKRRCGERAIEEKNICDNVIYTLLNDSTKSKDHLNARKDLKALGCKQDLWPDENGKYTPAIFTTTNKGKKTFLSTLKNISVTDGYSSNISRCIDVDNLKINGMLKSHDNHILMQQLLPLAMRTSLPSEVSAILIELCSFFRKLCDKRLIIKDLDKLQDQIVLTLSHMEMLFPPSFFTVMIHLVVHLVEEVKLGGPVHYRWMYPIEKYLGQLKSYMRNQAQPEGSIAEGYLMQEILTFCSRYLDNIETIWN
nr:uncharacterized protein LOC112717339 [Arachis hypogaea]